MNQPVPRILVIDNDEGMVAALTARLEHAGYECATAGCGRQGLATFREGGVDLVISDLNMPAGDGVTLVRAIRETSDVPVVIVTGFQDEFRRQLRVIPNVTIVRKPFAADELLELVEADLVMTGRELPMERAA